MSGPMYGTHGSQNAHHWWSLRKAFENYVVFGYGYVAASLLWLLGLHVQLSISLSALFAYTSLGRDDDFN
jgi:hypothetical protein